MTPVDASRRQFVLTSLSGLGSVWFATRWPAILAAQQQAQAAEPGKFQFFSPEQAANVEAIAAQIIPTTDTPGAREARVVYFIDRVLVTLDKPSQPKYVEGLKDLHSKVQGLFPGAGEFSSLTSDQQIRVLTAIEKTEFFEYVRYHTIVGFLANPEYGGNYKETGWKVIGFESDMHFEPPFGYYDAEENKAQSNDGQI